MQCKNVSNASINKTDNTACISIVLNNHLRTGFIDLSIYVFYAYFNARFISNKINRDVYIR